MSAAPDDLDTLLQSLLAAPAPAPEPEAEAKPALVVATATLLPPELPADAAAVRAALRAWLDAGAPGGTWQAPELGPPAAVAEPLEPEFLLELAAARAWRDGDQEAFDRALERLPADLADHHRRMAAVVDMIKTRQQARVALAPTLEGRS
jgi:hypothetical protein